MSFSDAEIERYKRHLILKEVGGAGQQKLKGAKVLVIGAGGLGSPILAYLAAAGVGTLGIIDDDKISLSNLQRQIIHDTDQVGAPKVESAKRTISRINPHVTVTTFNERLTATNAPKRIEAFDLVVDGCDNFQTRYLVADACELAKRPLVFAAVGPFDGQLSVFKPYQNGTDGTAHPGYRCLFPTPPEAGAVPSCAETGVLGAVVGVLGTLAAMEVLKLVLEIGEPLVRRLLVYEGLSARFTTINYNRDANSRMIHDLSAHQ